MSNNTVKQPLLEKVYDLLNSGKQPKTFYELLEMIPEINDWTEEDRNEYVARLYTNMNLDGRFLSIGDNFWGLRQWYPVEQREEEVAVTLAPKRRKKKKDDDFDDYGDLEDDIDDYDEGFDDDDFDDEEYDDDVEEDEDFDDFEEDEEDLDDTDDDVDDLDDTDDDEEEDE